MTQPPKYDFWPFVLPLVVFMVAGMVEPKFEPPETSVISETDAAQNPSEGERTGESTVDEYETEYFQRQVTRYVWVYAIKIAIVSGLLVFFWRTYLGQFPLSATWLSLGVGVIGVVLWIGACRLGIESALMSLLGVDSDAAARSAFNPFNSLPDNWLGFLLVRFAGLVIAVPICEELFLRGFLIRYVHSPEWWNVGLTQVGIKAMVVAPIYGALTHPAEAIAAILWFSLVTWLMRRTGKFWDCVIAHAVTNLLLGIYIIAFGQWQLW